MRNVQLGLREERWEVCRYASSNMSGIQLQVVTRGIIWNPVLTLPRCACNAADTVPGNSFGKMSKYGCHHDRVPVRASRYLASNMMKILVDMVREGEETVPPGRSEHRIGTQVAQ